MDLIAGDLISLQVGAVLVLATFVRSAMGFGEGLVAAPLLVFLMPLPAVAPLAALVSITVALLALIQDSAHVDGRSAWRLLLATIFGIPLGIWLVARAPQLLVKALLGISLIALAAFFHLKKSEAHLKTDRSAALFGFGAGVLGGAFGLNGPLLAVYGTLRRWPPHCFRATLQGYFLPASAIGMAGYWLAGSWTLAVTRYYLLALPFMIGAAFAGRWCNRRMDQARFLAVVHGALALIGMILLLQTLRP